MNPSATPSNLRLAEWSLITIIGASLGIVLVGALAPRSALVAWAGAIGGGMAGLALSMSVLPNDAPALTTGSSSS